MKVGDLMDNGNRVIFQQMNRTSNKNIKISQGKLIRVGFFNYWRENLGLSDIWR